MIPLNNNTPRHLVYSVVGTCPSPAPSLPAHHTFEDHNLTTHPISAMTSMLEDACQTLVDYLTFTETDMTSMSEADRHKVTNVLHSLHKLMAVSGIPSAFPQLYTSDSRSALPPLTLSSSSPSRVPTTSSLPATKVAAKRSVIPSWVTVPKGAIVPPGTSAPTAPSPPPPLASGSVSLPTTTAGASDSDLNEPKSSSAGRAYWTDTDYKFLLDQVAQYGSNFRHIHDLHGPNGTETQTLANYTLTQLQHKWHNGLKGMSDRKAAEWVAKATRAGEAFAAKCAEEAAAVSAPPAGNRWTDDEFQFLCQQIAKHGTQFKLIWMEHGAEGTESQTLARFTATQLQAKWHNVKKWRSEEELMAPYSDLVQARRAAEAQLSGDTSSLTSLDAASRRIRWTEDEIQCLCENVGKYGTHFQHIWNEHGPEGSVSKALARFSVLQLQKKWYNVRNLPEYSALAAAAAAARADTPTHPLAEPMATSRWTDADIQFLHQQVALHGKNFKRIAQLHGDGGTQSQTLARFSAAQMQSKWYKTRPSGDGGAGAADSRAPTPDSMREAAVNGDAGRAAWAEDDFAFLCDQLLEHGGPRAIPRIWEMHGPEGTVSRRLAAFTLRQLRFKWYNALKLMNLRALATKVQLDGRAGADGSQGEWGVDGQEEDELMEEDELAEDASAEQDRDRSGSERPLVDELGTAASPRKRPRLDEPH